MLCNCMTFKKDKVNDASWSRGKNLVYIYLNYTVFFMEKKRDLAKQEMPREKQDPLILFLSLTERQQRNRWNLQQSFLPRNPHKAQ